MPVSTAPPHALPGGIYCPTITFFRDTPAQELDLEVFTKHIAFLARAGLQGVVVLGSTGEAVALRREESEILIRTAKETFTSINSAGIVIAGTGAAQTTREAIDLARGASAAGADFVLTLPPSYYPGAMTPAAIQQFYEDVADSSPVPLIIYSYPGVSSGIVMDTDLVRRLATHPKIAGIKHTDHEVGRIAREASVKSYGSPFTVLGGASDYLLGTLAVGGKGAITGMANLTPRALAKVYELANAGRVADALELAGLISRAEWSIGKGGILGTKYAIAWANGYPATAALARKPLPLVLDSVKQNLQTELAEVLALERKLEADNYVGTGLKPAGRIDVRGIDGKTNHTLVDLVKEKLTVV